MIKIEINQTIFINLPIEGVFAYISALEKTINWSSSTISIKPLFPGAIQVGATMQVTIRFLGRWLDMTFEVIEYHPLRCLTFKSVSGIASCFLCYHFEPTEDGGTTLSQEVLLHFTEGSQVLVERILRRQYECDLLTLKDLLEARSSAEL